MSIRLWSPTDGLDFGEEGWPAMRLYSAGINHNDPLMRKELKDWLQQLKNQHHSDPCFIAAEWGEHAHGKVADSRDEFKELAKKQWPGVSEDVVTVLTNAMGYEGDAHRTLWPDIEPIWLDDDREISLITEYNLDHYATGRLDIYMLRLGGLDPVADPVRALQRLSDAAHVSQQTWADNPRDESWAKQITAARRGGRYSRLFAYPRPLGRDGDQA